MINLNYNQNIKNDLSSEADIDNENETKIRLIISKYLPYTQTILKLCQANLYISKGQNLEYNLVMNGILCLTISRTLSNLYIQMYDIYDFKKQFEIELYLNVEFGLEQLEETFYSIEYPTFFLGINFANEYIGKEIKNLIILYSTVLNSKYHQFSYEKNPINRKSFSIKIEKIEPLINFSYNSDINEVIYDISRGANRFLESYNISMADLNYEYEVVRNLVKVEPVNQNIKKSLKTNKDILDKEKIEKIMNEIKKLEGDRIGDELEIIKKKNKVNKFNYANRINFDNVIKIESDTLNKIIKSDEDSNSEEESLNNIDVNHTNKTLKKKDTGNSSKKKESGLKKGSRRNSYVFEESQHLESLNSNEDLNNNNMIDINRRLRKNSLFSMKKSLLSSSNNIIIENESDSNSQ